jgi:hypothetical protein
MTDDRLDALLRGLDVVVTPDARFAEQAYAVLAPRARKAGRSDRGAFAGVRRRLAWRSPVTRRPVAMRWAAVGLGSLVVLALVLGILLALGASRRVPDGPLVYARGTQVFVVDDAGLSTPIGEPVVSARSTTRSRDGRYVAFDRDADEGGPVLRSSGVVIMTIADGTSRPIDAPAELGSLAWSSADDLAWFSPRATADGSTELPQTVDIASAVDGSLRTWDRPAGGIVDSLAWAPDGRHLAVSTRSLCESADGTEPGAGLFVLDAATGAGREIGSGLTVSDLAWSPDGSRLAVTVPHDGSCGDDWSSGHLEILDPATGSMTAILDGVPVGNAARWMPDGRAIVYLGNELQVRRIAPDGTDDRLIATGADGIRLSPDGSRVLYWSQRPGLKVGDGGGTETLWVVDALGGQPTLLADGVIAYGSRWSPSGGFVAYLHGPVTNGRLAQGPLDLHVIAQDGRDDRIQAEQTFEFDWGAP